MEQETEKDVFKRLGFSGSYPSPIERVFSDKEIADTQRQLKEEGLKRTEDMSFFDLIGKRQADQGTAFELHSLIKSQDFKGEPEIITPEMSEKLIEGLVSERAIRDVLEGTSKHGFRYGMLLGNQFRQSDKIKKDLSDAGMRGALAGVASDLLDPADTAIMATTAYGVTAAAPALAPVTAPLAVTGVKAARIFSRFKDNRKYYATAFGVGATETAALETLRAQTDYEIGGGDIVLAASLAGGLVTGFAKGGQVLRKRAYNQDLLRKIADDEELTEAEQAYVRANSPEQVNPTMVREAIERDDFNVVESAFEQDTRTLKDIPSDEAPLEMRGGGLSVRGLIASMPRIMNSEEPLARVLGSKLGLISTGLKGKTTPFGANELRDALQSQIRGRMSNPIRDIQKRWKDTVSKNTDDLEIQASEYLRYADETVHPLAKEMALLMRPEMDRMLAQAQKFGVAGFIKNADMRLENYLPRFRDNRKIKELKEKYGADAEIFEELAEEAIRQGQPNIVRNIMKMLAAKGKKATATDADAFIKKMSRGYIRRFMDLDSKDGLKLGNNDVDLEEFESFLELDFDADEIDIIIETLTYSKKVKGYKRSKPRMQLNERATITKVINGEEVTLRFDDLLEKNAVSIFDGFVFQMSGAIALARNGIDTNTAGSTFTSQIALLRKGGKVKDSEITALEFLYDTVKGTHVYRSGWSPTTIRNLARLREYSFAVSMGMSGMASLMELPMVTLPYGIEVLRKTVPQFPKLFRDLTNKEIRSKLGREMAAGTGLGSDGIINKVTPMKSRAEGEGLEGIQFNQELNKLDEALGYGRVYMSLMSGLTGVTDMLRRISNLNYATKWSVFADKDKLPFSKVHREQLGISDEQARDMLEQIRKYRTFQDDGEIDALNVDTWDRKDLADLFMLSARREATQNVMEMNAGSVNGTLRSPVGMTMFQFLSFPLSSMEQITMRLGVRAVNGEGIEVSKLILASTLLGGLMYGARSYLNSMGRSDQDKYLEERMTPANILKGSLSQVGPFAMSSYIYQVTNGLIDGNTRAVTPAGYSIVGGFGKGIGDIYESLGGDQMTESELRGMLRVLPFSSLYGARQILNAMANGLTTN